MRNVVIPDVGDVIAGRYRLDGILGRGGFGIVFKATHLEMSRPVAIKTLLPQGAATQTAVDRFRQEAVLASSLTHPNTITLFDYGQTPEGLFFLVMEYLRGHTLKDRLKRVGSLPPKRARAMMVQILKSLAEAHNLGIVHRDLKPENIFLCEVPGEQDFIKVLDFGIAKIIEGEPASPDADLSAGATFGTPKYMAPEQISGGQLGPYTDFYALGLIAFEAVMGRSAYNGRTPLEIIAKQANSKPPRLPAHIRSTPIGQMITQAIQKDPQARFQHAREALEMLLEADFNPQDVPSGLPPARPNGSLLGGSIPTSGWGVAEQDGPMDSGRFFAEGVLDDASSAPMESEATIVQPSASTDGVFDSGRFLSEGSLGDVDDGGFEEEATRVEAGLFGDMEDQPTTMSSQHGGPAHDPMESEPTRVRVREDSTMNLTDGDIIGMHTDHRADIAARIAAEDSPMEASRTVVHAGRLQKMPGAQVQAEAPLQAQMLASAPAVVRTPSAPAPLPSLPSLPTGAPAPQPGEVDDSSVLYSVESHMERPTASVRGGMAGRSRSLRADAPVPQSVASPKRVSTDHGKRKKGMDRNLIIALAVLGVGLMAMLSVVVLYVLKPTLGLGDAPIAAPLESDVKAKGAVLTFQSNPSGAEVLVDGKVVGETPIDVEQTLSRGVVNVVLRKDGYEDERDEYTYDGDKTVKLELSPSKDGPRDDDPPEVAEKDDDKASDDDKVEPKAKPRKDNPPVAKKVTSAGSKAKSNTGGGGGGGGAKAPAKSNNTAAKRTTPRKDPPPRTNVARSTNKKRTTTRRRARRRASAFGKW